ncbi:hypothetical protein [Actinoplanes derwentensis]|uniref:Tape measure protein n=1 Tax=Actinoplanes derwentensis TaxID=113562 RepID=A0A1H2CV90_9ACTN|nr:hypothetical protein [Actinoplanes derwentensis]GID82025.1 hypothetical protein Ade03nite_09490 [Actinoplanes derwentensis]SDT74393.1 hypothetical protein SAMN04489716_6969 [Actinoplanes derwentensis]
MGAAKTYSAGTAWLQVVPSLEDIEDLLGKEVGKLGRNIEKTLGSALPQGMAQGAKRARPLGEQAGMVYGGSFGKTAVRQIEKAWQALPEPEPKMTKWQSRINEVRKELRSIQGDALGGNIDEKALVARVQAAADRLQVLQGAARTAGQFHNARDAARELETFLDVADDAARRGAVAGRGFGGAFVDQVARSLDEAIAALPAFPVGVDTDEARDQVARLRDELFRLSALTIGIDIDPDAAMAQILRVREELRALADDGDVEIQFAAETAGGKLGRLLGEDARRRGKADAEAYSGAFDTHLRSSLFGALEAIPDVPLSLDTSAAQANLAVLRDQIEDLADRRIGVDIDAIDAYAEFLRLHTALRALEAEDVDLDVRVNAASAADAMSRFANETDNGSGALQRMDQQARLTMSRLGLIVGLSASFGAAFVPAVLSAAAAVGFLGAAGLAAGSGLGVLALGLNGIGDAVGALNQAEQSADRTAQTVARAQASVRQATEGVAQAEAGQARTRQQIADSAEDAARRVHTAEADLAEARRAAGRDARDGARAVAAAQRDVTEVEAAAVAVRRDLNAAYQEAARSLEDLQSKLATNAIDQRKASTAIMQAHQELQAVIANPRATDIERRQARERYDERVQQYKDLQQQGNRLGQDLAAANRKGLEGSDEVVAVRERIAAADQRVADARARLTRTQEQAAESQRQAGTRIAASQQQVTDAQRAQARAAVDGAYQVQQASAAIRSARAQEAQAYTDLGAAGGEAARTLTTAMADLTPAGREFAGFIFGLKDEALALRAAGQENLLPGLQEAITLSLPYLPGLEDFIGRVAGKVGDLAVQSSRAFGGATWQRFFAFVGQDAVPQLQQMYDIGSDLTEGLLALYLALVPFNGQVGGGLASLAQDFADWANNLDRTQGYRDFLDYVREQGPEVVELLGSFAEAVVNIAEAGMPLGALMIDATNGVLEFVNAIPGPALTGLVSMLGLAAAGVIGLSAAIRVGKFKNELSEIFGPAMQSMVQRYAVDTGRATTETGKLRTAVATAGGVASAAGNKFLDAGQRMAGVASALVGPWGLGIAVATGAVMYFGAKTAEQQAKVDGLTSALAAINDEFRDLKAQGVPAADATATAIRRAVENNPQLQEAVVALDEMGVSFAEIVEAASSGDPSQIVARLNEELAEQAAIVNQGGRYGAKENDAAVKRIQNIQDLKDAFVANAQAIGLAARAQDVLNTENSEHNAILQFREQHPDATPAQIQAQTGAYRANADQIDDLTVLLNAFAAGQNDATIKADALRRAIDDQSGALISAEEAGDTWNAQLLSLSESVDSNGRSLAMNTREGLANRDALQAAAKATRDLYLEEIASGKPMADATKAHQDRIGALREEAKRLGIAGTETDRLIDLYGEVPDDVQTIYTTKGFKDVYLELAQLKFMQDSLNKGWSVEKAQKEWEIRKMYLTGEGGPPFPNLPAKADGGRITGPGSGTSDDVLLWGSNGEWVHTAAAVNFYGDDFMQAINTMSLPKQWLPGFSTGGRIGEDPLPRYATGGKVMTWPAAIDLTKTLIPSLQQATAALGDAANGLGWQWQMKVLRAAFPGLALYSGHRVDSRTANGSLSWHSREGVDADGRKVRGRAVDVPPRQDVFDAIHRRYRANTKELIWGGDPDRNIYHGKTHRFSDSLLAQHGPYQGKRGPSPHIHWAFDQGGWLMPGMPSINNLREPEPVLTPWQWDAIEAYVGQGLAGAGTGPTYHFAFTDTTLTPERLSAIQQRQDALARVGRPR